MPIRERRKDGRRGGKNKEKVKEKKCSFIGKIKTKTCNQMSLLPLFNYSCPVCSEPVVLNLGAAAV